MTDMSADGWVSRAHRPMGFPEFLAIVASIMALNPFATDMMLPAMPEIGAAFGITNANHIQTVVSVYLAGFGAGQFIMGPLSDRFGRRPILIGGMLLYCVASLLSVIAPSFEMLLLARALQGVGTSATRVIATSIVRDCYAGRRMASVISLAMMIFVAVPVLAPSVGQAIMLFAEWRGIFMVLTAYGLLALLWSAIRLPETLPVKGRKPLTASNVFDSFRQTLTNRQTIGYALAAGGIQSVVFAYVFSSQQIFTVVYGLGHYFPLAFAAIAIGIAAAGFLNSRIVGRYGMRVISHSALMGSLAIAAVTMLAAWHGWLSFPVYMVLAIANMFAFGLMFSNFTALAMEPQGHIAGTASSLFGSITTLIGSAAGALIGQDFNGTMLPFTTGAFLCTLAALVIVIGTERGRLFVPHNAVVQTPPR
ncbi:MAG: multidrug effflux MFS transporter [Proteobacteria bacterium]|nr:multidrug effflux MFS transporter [Pseudomonadota bacterium]